MGLQKADNQAKDIVYAGRRRKECGSQTKYPSSDLGDMGTILDFFDTFAPENELI